MMEALFDEDTIDSAAFALSTASTIGHYVNMAKKHAHQGRGAELALPGTLSLNRMLVRSRELATSLEGVQARDLPEVELALLLVPLAASAHPAVEPFLHHLRARPERTGSLAWIRCLADRLVHGRRGTSILQQELQGMLGRLSVVRSGVDATTETWRQPVYVVRKSTGEDSRHEMEATA